MIDTIALLVVLLTGGYFLCLGIASLLAPGRVSSYFLGFAATPRVHYLEMATRLLVGGAMIVAAPRLYVAGVFEVFGWVLVISAAVLIILPWHWHQRFAEHVVPPFTRYITLIGLCSLALGTFLLWAFVKGSPV